MNTSLTLKIQDFKWTYFTVLLLSEAVWEILSQEIFRCAVVAASCPEMIQILTFHSHCDSGEGQLLPSARSGERGRWKHSNVLWACLSSWMSLRSGIFWVFSSSTLSSVLNIIVTSLWDTRKNVWQELFNSCTTTVSCRNVLSQTPGYIPEPTKFTLCPACHSHHLWAK